TFGCRTPSTVRRALVGSNGTAHSCSGASRNYTSNSRPFSSRSIDKAAGRSASARLALGGQETRDAADHRVGVFLPALRGLHQRRVRGILHVAALDQNRRVLREVQAGQIRASIQAVLPDVVGWRDSRGL